MKKIDYYSYHFGPKLLEFDRKKLGILSFLQLVFVTNIPLYTKKRFYHGGSLKRSLICELECLKDLNNPEIYLNNVDMCNINDFPLVDFSINFMIERFWRFLGNIFIFKLENFTNTVGSPLFSDFFRAPY